METYRTDLKHLEVEELSFLFLEFILLTPQKNYILID
jgi:hypothetical protein